MKLYKQDYISIIILVILLILAISIYPRMPEKMPVHWNAKGQIDSYGNRFIGVFLLPLIIVALYLLLLYIPKIEVYKDNLKSFMNYFNWMKVFLVSFFAVFYFVTLLPNFGITFNILYAIIPIFTILFFYIGYIMQFVKRNYFIGIRTPWTLADEDVWEKTHRIGSKTFMINAVIILAALIWPVAGFMIFISSIVINVLFLYIYSYVVWKKIVKTKKQ